MNPNPIFGADGGKLPITGIRIRKLATNDCAIASSRENYSRSPEQSRVKRCVHKHFRQSHGFCRGSSGLETAEMRYSVSNVAAILPQGEI